VEIRKRGDYRWKQTVNNLFKLHWYLHFTAGVFSRGVNYKCFSPGTHKACFIRVRPVRVITSVLLQLGLYCPWRTRGSRLVCSGTTRIISWYLQYIYNIFIGRRNGWKRLERGVYGIAERVRDVYPRAAGRHRCSVFAEAGVGGNVVWLAGGPSRAKREAVLADAVFGIAVVLRNF